MLEFSLWIPYLERKGLLKVKKALWGATCWAQYYELWVYTVNILKIHACRCNLTNNMLNKRILASAENTSQVVHCPTLQRKWPWTLNLDLNQNHVKVLVRILFWISWSRVSRLGDELSTLSHLTRWPCWVREKLLLKWNLGNLGTLRLDTSLWKLVGDR